MRILIRIILGVFSLALFPGTMFSSFYLLEFKEVRGLLTLILGAVFAWYFFFGSLGYLEDRGA